MDFYNPTGTNFIFKNGIAVGVMLEEHMHKVLEGLNDEYGGAWYKDKDILELLDGYDTDEIKALIKLDKDLQILRETVIDKLEALDIQFIGLEDITPAEYALLTRKLLKSLAELEIVKPIEHKTKKPCKTKSK